MVYIGFCCGLRCRMVCLGLVCVERLKNGIHGVVMCLEKGAKNKFVKCLQKGVCSGIHWVVSV